MKFSGCYGDIQTKTADFKSFICKGWRCKNYRNNFIFKQNHDFKRRFQDAMVTSRQESQILNHTFARDGCAKIVENHFIFDKIVISKDVFRMLR